MGDSDQETGWPNASKLVRRFHTASGRAFPQEEKAWMFDNEIDWVKRIGSASRRQVAAVRRPPGDGAGSNGARIQGRAQAIKPRASPEQSGGSGLGKCSSKKSVFRRCGDCACECARPLSRRK